MFCQVAPQAMFRQARLVPLHLDRRRKLSTLLFAVPTRYPTYLDSGSPPQFQNSRRQAAIQVNKGENQLW